MQCLCLVCGFALQAQLSSFYNIILCLCIQVDKKRRIPRYANNKIAVLIRLFLRIAQRICRNNIELYMVATFLKKCLDQIGQRFKPFLPLKR